MGRFTGQRTRAGPTGGHDLQPIGRSRSVCGNQSDLRQGGSDGQDSGELSDRGDQRDLQRHAGYVHCCLGFRNHRYRAHGRNHRHSPSGHIHRRHSLRQRAVHGDLSAQIPRLSHEPERASTKGCVGAWTRPTVGPPARTGGFVVRRFPEIGLCPRRSLNQPICGCGKKPPQSATRKCLKLRTSPSRILVRLMHQFLLLFALDAYALTLACADTGALRHLRGFGVGECGPRKNCPADHALNSPAVIGPGRNG
jgi:hypothetical protein